MNFFDYKCPFCHTAYNEVVEKGKTVLLHLGLLSTNDDRGLPTSKCVPYHNYVKFEPCGHCCPDVFAECRACKLGFEGKLHFPSHPTEKECFCHYCIPSKSIDSTHATLHLNLTEYFSVSELRQLCLHLNIKYEEFSQLLSKFAQELIEYCYRRNLIQELILACKKMRPHVNWDL